MAKQRIPLAQRLWEKVTVTEGCWTFDGARDHNGYGYINAGVRGRTMFAHKAAYLIGNGPIPEGMNVLHRCDNPPCCRPDHLFLGTHADNVADKTRKGRQLKGEQIHNSKLTAADVLEIRQLLKSGHRVFELANSFGVHWETIADIKKGATWKHVTL